MAYVRNSGIVYFNHGTSIPMGEGPSLEGIVLLTAMHVNQVIRGVRLDCGW